MAGRGAVLPPTKQFHVVTNYFRRQVTVCLGIVGKASCLVCWCSRPAKANRLGTILFVVLFIVCMTLIVLLFVWGPFSHSLSHLSNGYFAMYHMNTIVQHMRDTNNLYLICAHSIRCAQDHFIM